MRFRALLAITVLAILAAGFVYGETLVVGNCAAGKEFNTLEDAITYAHELTTDANIIVCSDQQLPYGATVRGYHIYITGWPAPDGSLPTISSPYPVRMIFNTVRSGLYNLRLNNIAVKILEGIHKAKNVEINSNQAYCFYVNTDGDFKAEDVNLSSCPQGILIVRASDVNIWSVEPANAAAITIENNAQFQTLTIGPVVRYIVKTVEKPVEIRVPVEKIVYKTPPDLQQKIEGCEKTVAELSTEKAKLENRCTELEAELTTLRKSLQQQPIMEGVSAAVAGIVLGYLLARIIR